MSIAAKLPSERALEIITTELSEELSIHPCDQSERSKAHLYEIGGPGGRQFALIVGDMYAAKGPNPSQQTRILLGKCKVPDIAGVSPCDDYYSGSRIKQADSRIAPPNQSSYLVADESALRGLLRWYAQYRGRLDDYDAAPLGSLERTRLEKAAQDAGFDLSPTVERDWLVFRSTAFPCTVGVASEISGYRVAVSDAGLARRVATEFTAVATDATPPWAVCLNNIQDYPTLHRLFGRIAAVSRVLAGEGLRAFEESRRHPPDTTEATRLVVQRVGQDIFRASLLAYWGQRCAVSGLAVPGLLRASHIKPWADCGSDAERLDVFNGLLLAPHLDALFDGGWVTFLDSGQIRISDALDAASRTRLGLTGAEAIIGLTERHQAYLAWHREHCFDRKK